MTITNLDGSLACICHEHRPACDCVLVAPPIAPAPFVASPAQHAFLALHVEHAVTAWRWHWAETILRAKAGVRTATLWRDEIEDMVAAGLMEWGYGCADVRPTEAGREAAQASRERT